jgi:phosphoglycolate phosphatase
MNYKDVKLIKWPHKKTPTAELVKKEMEAFGYVAYDHQTIPGWFERSSHSHNEPEIRGATQGTTTFHFSHLPPITIEAGDILFIPPLIAHTVVSHHGGEFSAFKGSLSGNRSVSEHSDGKGSLEQLNIQKSLNGSAKKNTVVFIDLDGTLEDSRQDMCASVLRVREHLGLPVKPALNFESHVNKGMRELYLNCFEDFFSTFSKKSLENHLQWIQTLYEKDYLENICHKTKLYEGVFETLKTLSAECTLICVTNKPEKHSNALLASLGVKNFFDLVVGGDTYEKCKPSPLPLACAIQKLNLNPIKTFMVGDSLGDLLCGLEFGAEVIWCSWGYSAQMPHAPTGKPPQHTATKPSDIVAIAMRQ